MKILISSDNDGHFNAAHLSDRKAVIKLLETIEEGYYREIINDNEIQIPKDLDNFCCKSWREFIGNFIHRGRLELVDIPDVAPQTCQSTCQSTCK